MTWPGTRYATGELAGLLTVVSSFAAPRLVGRRLGERMPQSRLPVDVSGRPLRLRDVDLDTFLHPTTVAVIGASEASRKPNAAMTLRIKHWADEHGASFFPVHPVYETVLGARCYPNRSRWRSIACDGVPSVRLRCSP